MSGSQSISWTWTQGQSPTACFIDETGIHAPPFDTIMAYLQGQVQSIYGSDIYIGNDTQDGQLLGLFATAIYDTNSMAIAAYNSFSPATALGVGLSSVVKINGIARSLPTNSTVDLVISGVAGTQIFNGLVGDVNGQQWSLPPTVTIPTSGAITVTAIALDSGAITAAPDTVTNILTPTLGWQSVTNMVIVQLALAQPANNTTILNVVTTVNVVVGMLVSGTLVVGTPVVTGTSSTTITISVPQTLAIGTILTFSSPTIATVGAPLETDSELRQRQTVSTMLPSVTALDGMIGSVAAVLGPNGRYRVYENDTNLTDANGVPGHSIAFVTQGGDAQAIANAIAAHKTPGAGTYGTTTEVVVDPYGVPHNINFFVAIVVPVTVVIHLTALIGYTSAIGQKIVNAVINYITTNPIGQNVFNSKVITVANLSGSDSLTFNITSILMSRAAGTPSQSDVTIAFNETSFASTATVTLSIP